MRGKRIFKAFSLKRKVIIKLKDLRNVTIKLKGLRKLIIKLKDLSSYSAKILSGKHSWNFKLLRLFLENS